MLTQQFNGIVGRPQVTYLTGASMGGRVTAAAIEQFPRAYDGALPICGVLGDHELFDFYLDYSLVAARRRPTAASSRPRPGPSPRPARSVVVAARWRLPPCRYSTLPRFRSPSGPG